MSSYTMPQIADWYAVVGATSGELLSYKGCVLVHDNPKEMEFLLIGIRGTTKLPGRHPKEVATKIQRRVMLLSDHPDLSWVTWPLNRDSFWDAQPRTYTQGETVRVRREQWLL
jgi:hypothetical protein